MTYLRDIEFCKWCNQPSTGIHSCRQMWQHIHNQGTPIHEPQPVTVDLRHLNDQDAEIARLKDRLDAAQTAGLAYARERDEARREAGYWKSIVQGMRIMADTALTSEDRG